MINHTKPKEILKYLGGGWLEEWVYLSIKDLGFDEVAIGVQLKWPKSEPDKNIDSQNNELDIVISDHNRLITMECKTIGWRGKKQRTSEKAANLQSITDKIFKLRERIGGPMAKAYLVSARELATEHNIDAFKRLNIHIIQQAQIKDLPDMLWKQLRGKTT